MMVSNRAKGNRNQLKAIRFMEEKGFLVDKVEKTGKFAKVKDLFGLFDFVAIEKGKVCFVQVTTNTPHTHKKYQSFADQYELTTLQFVWFDRKGWKIFSYHKNKKKYVEDLRK